MALTMCASFGGQTLSFLSSSNMITVVISTSLSTIVGLRPRRTAGVSTEAYQRGAFIGELGGVDDGLSEGAIG